MNSKFISKRYRKKEMTPMGQTDELAKGFNDLINLALGDPDFITDDIIIDSAFADAKAGHTKYTDFRGDPELRQEIVQFYKDEYGINVDDKEVFITTSGCLGLYLVLEAILDDGDEVILQAPYFTPYAQQVELARGIPVELPTYEEEDFQINMERLEGLISGSTKAIVINTPSNPTGSCLTYDTMKKLAEVAKKHDLVVIADDIYTSFSYEAPFIPFLSIDGMKERTVTINSFSKNFMMTGWRVGNIIANKEIIETVQMVNENVVFTTPAISQRAAIHALRNRDRIQPKFLAEYKERTYYAAERINNIPKMSVLAPKGTFYLFANIKETGLSSVEVSDIILHEAHVLTIPGISFGQCGEGYIRFACNVKKEVLKETFDRIERVSIFAETKLLEKGTN